MIYYDFHIHSALSPCGDSDMTPNNIVNMAKLSGLSVIAVSDHNTVGNVRATMKAGENCGVRVIPAMEVETAEEVHILTLFQSVDSAEYAAEEIYSALPSIKNRPEIFGEQILMNENDEIVGYEDRLLISPTSISIEKLFDLVKSAKGLFIPAHVDRHSYSVLTNLGFIPDNIDIRIIEMSKKISDTRDYLRSRPELEKYKILQNSDAHYLEDITQQQKYLEEDIDKLFEEANK